MCKQAIRLRLFKGYGALGSWDPAALQVGTVLPGAPMWSVQDRANWFVMLPGCLRALGMSGIPDEQEHLPTLRAAQLTGMVAVHRSIDCWLVTA